MEIAAILVFLAVVSYISTTGWAAVAAAALLVGTVGFWAFLIFSSIIILTCIENDKELAAFLSTVATFVTLQFFSIDLISHIRAHPSALIWGAGLYFILGTTWSFFKWFLHCRDERKRLDEWNKGGKKKGYDRAGVLYGGGISVKPTKPLASENKSRITGWMTFWPWSLVWFVINDPVRRAFQAIYDRFQNTYQRISDKAFAGVEEA